ncbi:MAG: mechanosensitive ion channel family protein [Steroidobacteraceae bacterium]
MNSLLAALDDLYLDNTLGQWLWAIGTAVAVLLITVFIRRLVRLHYRRMAETEEIELMEVPLQIASKTTTLFLLVLGLFFGMLTLTLPDTVHRIGEKILLINVCWQVGIWATTGALAWIDSKRRASLTHDRATAGTLGIVAIIVRVVIWSIVLLLTLDNLGINITTLVAGFGIGGIAVALAVQNVLGDLLASLSITLDKPFVVGDSLVVDTFNGTVEHIGLKSTRMRSVTGEQIIMPNADLLKSRLRNYGRMNERRMIFSLGLVYETPREKLAQLPQLLRGIIEAQPSVRFDRCHLVRFGASAIEFEASYFVQSARMNDSMDVQHAINIAILAAFEVEKLEFAYPTQRILMEHAPDAEV